MDMKILMMCLVAFMAFGLVRQNVKKCFHEIIWFDLSHTVVSYQSESISQKRELPFLPPVLPWVMKEGDSKKAAFILMKNCHFDRALRYLLGREKMMKATFSLQSNAKRDCWPTKVETISNICVSNICQCIQRCEKEKSLVEAGIMGPENTQIYQWVVKEEDFKTCADYCKNWDMNLHKLGHGHWIMYNSWGIQSLDQIYTFKKCSKHACLYAKI